MSDGQEGLPEGWAWTTLDDLGLPKTTKVTPSASEDQRYELWSVPNYPHGPEILEGSEIGSSKQIVGPGDVLLCKINPRINRVEVVGEPGNLPQIASTEWVVVRSDGATLPAYLRHAFSEASFRRELNKDVSGVGGSLIRARPQAIRKLIVPVAPENEQRRIVAKIESLGARSEAAKEALDAIPPLLEKFRQSVLAAAFRGDLTAAWRAKNPDVEPASVLALQQHQLPDEYQRLRKIRNKGTVTLPDDAFPDLPTTWCYRSVNQLYDSGIILDYADGNHGSLYPRKAEFGPSGVTFVTATQIDERGRIDLAGAPLLNSEKAHQLKKGWARGGDVLLTHNATVGRTARVPDDAGNFLLGTSATFYRTQSDVLDPDYLYFALTAPSWQRQLRSIMEQTTRNQVSIQKQAFFGIPFAPFGEQRAIVALLKRAFAWADAMEDSLTAALSNAASLNQSILAKAFRGELVPQDPTDEPASVLLERIRAEREAAEAAKKASKKNKRRGATA